MNALGECLAFCALSGDRRDYMNVYQLSHAARPDLDIDGMRLGMSYLVRIHNMSDKPSSGNGHTRAFISTTCFGC